MTDHYEFTSTSTNTKQIYYFFEILKDITAHANINLYSDGIGISSIDSNHVCLVTFNIHKDQFIDFKCDEAFRIGIHIQILCKILKCSSKSINS